MKRILGLAGLLLLFAACEQFGIDTKETLTQDPARSDVKVFASIEQPASAETKVYADADLKVLWNANDTISFFNKLTLNEKWKFIGEEGDNVGQFEQIGTIVGTGNDLDYYCAVYPYRSATRISTENLLTVTLPATQTYAENSFGRGMNTMVAVSPTSVFTFKNVCGYLSFKLYGEGICVSSITLEGNNNEPLAGNGTIPMAIDSLPKITMSDVAAKEITLVCDPPVALGTSAADYTEFWMVVPPTVFESGFTITIKASNGMSTSKSLSTSLEIERSKIRRMAPFEVALHIPEAVDLGLPSGLKWASFNIGASAPEEFGDVYAWGETEPKEDFSWDNYKFSLGIDLNGPFSKYVTESKYGSIDGKTILDLEDDAANVNWGDSWRMPTREEFAELKDTSNCEWTWTTENGVTGYRITGKKEGYTNVSIFLPGATDGRRSYWTSSLYPKNPCSAYNLYMYPSQVYLFGSTRGFRKNPKPVRPVYAPDHVESVSLDKAEMTLFAGDSTSLIATLMPSAVLIPEVSWSSSDNSVATVDYSGKVKAVNPGNATITVTTTDGGKTASCNVTVAAQPEAVDLGLPSGLKWASFNVGANSPEEYGDYYAWGETTLKVSYSLNLYNWCNGSDITYTKYNTNSYNGIVDNKTVLDLEDDVAHVNWSGSWRIPTLEEFNELCDNCTVVWTTVNGVKGRRFTSKINLDKSIFLPAAGCRHGKDITGDGSWSHYWSSSLTSGYPVFANTLYFDKSILRSEIKSRFYGCSVRPVFDNRVNPASVVLNFSSIMLYPGELDQLTATVFPVGAIDKTVSWSSSNPAVATVDQEGNVTAIAVGSATIMVTTHDGNLTASCKITVTEHSGTIPVAVDLGLSVKWASFNLGSTDPKEFGNYYAWGETAPKSSYTWALYKWCKGGNKTLTKYCPIDMREYWAGEGDPDSKTSLDLTDDAAHTVLGDVWRIPTHAEWTELRQQCSWIWTSMGGVTGYLVTSKITGYKDKWIFIPATGSRGNKKLSGAGCCADYWSSSLKEDYPSFAYKLYFDSSMIRRDYSSRFLGYAIRPVCE